MELMVDHHAVRASKARLRQRFDRIWQGVVALIAVLLVVSGVASVIFGMSVGWLLIGLAAIPYMLLAWRKGELAQLSVIRHPQTLSDIIESDVLGTLKDKAAPTDIALSATSTRGGLFFAARFGLTTNILQDIAAHPDVHADAIWQNADEIRKELAAEELTAGMIIAGCIKQVSNHEALLAHLHIEFSDIIEGIRWQLRLKDIILSSRAPLRTGGIARDWSFGYIPLLSQFGQNISQQIGRSGLLNAETSSHKAVIERMVETFGSGANQNVALIGPNGVGKTTVVEAFAEKLLDARSTLPANLKFRQVIMLDSASILSAAPGRGQIENLIMNILGEAFAAKNIIVCLDNAQLFFEEGVGSVDITNVLLPIIEAGRLRMILTMDEQRFLEISARNPNLANALSRVSVAATDEAESLQVMQHSVIGMEFRRHVTYTYQALKETYRLSSRYVQDIAMPGQALKLLESAASYAENGLVTINSVQQAIEQTMDIKVSVASESEDREKLLQLETLLHKRMIGQTRAVGVVSDALRRARAGVRNENRPIGTFLFLGPTGVGKTELSKALADVYFGGEQRMIRLDLNEYVRNEDVTRLIADGATDPTSLTAQVMKQPYSVVLLDEIEKAHPNVLTTLLQLLDEGVLRDINNREVSFRDAIVIATSNAGSDRIREYIQRGYKLEQFDEQFVNELIDSGQFKPEFLNRFDEIVTFTPLTKQDLLKIVDLMIAGVNKTLSIQKVSVSVDLDGKKALVDRGYDPRLGARPMRRVIQKAVENTVAKAMLAGQVEPGGIVEVSADQIEQILGSRDAANLIADEASQ